MSGRGGQLAEDSVERPADADTFEGGQGQRQERKTREQEGGETSIGLLGDVSKFGYRKISGHALFVRCASRK
jgi:hypothetical protein